MSCHLEVPAKYVVFIKGIIEASEGIANLVAEKGGSITLVYPKIRSKEFEILLQDLIHLEQDS